MFGKKKNFWDDNNNIVSQVFHSCVNEYEILLGWDLVDNLLITATTLKMDVASFSETSITNFLSIRYHISERFYLQQ
jgi:hypothetical protein